ncbi:AAA family ATPase, partial [Phocaeicola faecalis]
MKQQSLKRCPIGIQTFEEIINKDYLYIDKKEYIYRMAHGASNYYFLRRHRRFCISLV